MTFTLGLIFLIVGGFGLLMLDITQSVMWIPGGPVRKDEDPRTFWMFQIANASIGGIGLLLLLAHLVGL